MLKKELVIFGSSMGGIKVAKTLSNIGVDFKCFLDNDEKKWDKIVEGKPVKSPQCLLEKEYDIIIASAYQDEIEQQLSDMGIKEESIVLKEKYLMEYFQDNIDDYSFLNDVCRDNLLTVDSSAKEFNYIIDLAEGMEIGGIESWSYIVAEALLSCNRKVTIFSKITDTEPPKTLRNYIKMFDISYDGYKESVNALVDAMKDLLPFTMLANWMTQNYIAAYLLKCFLPDQVNIIGIVHHDMVNYYKRNQFLNPFIDAFLCVSADTRTKMINQYKIDEHKVFYKQVPISTDEEFVKNNLGVNEPVRVNFGARLVKSKKRADLIIPLIQKLEELKVNYLLNIAGYGDYFDKITCYARENNLSSKITLYGGLKFDRMKDFWRNGDIVISLSDSEGMGLSILEAMSCGEVPVVTGTAGIWDFVIQGENGFICEINNINEIADAIRVLDKDRDKLALYSRRSRGVIKSKCSLSGYIDIIVNIEKLIQDTHS